MERYRGNKIKSIIDRNLKKKNPKVLDIGCGQNNLFFGFKDYTGIDINDYGMSFNIIKQNLNENTNLPFPDNSFDLVIASEFLEHIFRPDLVAHEMNRVVKPGGIILISLPNEFTLNCRIGFAFNQVLNKGFDMYTHSYIFNVDRIHEFVNEYFKPIDSEMVCYGHIWTNLPDFINDLMVKVSPSLFAKSLIFVCKKKT